MSTTKPIHRLTLFKIPKEADRDRLIELFGNMTKDSLKVPLSVLPPAFLSGC